jgi:hypothetical protein
MDDLGRRGEQVGFVAELVVERPAGHARRLHRRCKTSWTPTVPGLCCV